MSKINFEGDAVANIEQTGLESVAGITTNTTTH